MKAVPVFTTKLWKRGRIYIKLEDHKWRLYHVWFWKQTNGPLPKGHVIHHIDFNPLNNNLNNLQCLTIGEHMKLHHKGIPTGPASLAARRNMSLAHIGKSSGKKGKHLSEETKAQISQSLIRYYTKA